mmetsp:Transcript_20294/g.24617  ORF Transcript_20294/g.24617 Transcript_20294/m.24617 type:complete len:566 (+) Transcript_20294:201-1898(+)
MGLLENVKFLLAFLRSNSTKLLKYYLAFAVANICYKQYLIKKAYREANRCFQQIPQRKIYDPFGSRIVKNIHRLNDHITELVHEFPNAPLVRLPGPGIEIVCQTPEAVEWMLRQEFKSFTKGNPNQILMYSLLKEFLGEGIFTLRHGDSDEILRNEDKKWYNTRKTTSKLFTKSQMMGHMHETFAAKGKILVEALEEYATRNKAVDIQAKFFAFTMDSIQKIFFGNEVDTVKKGEIDPYAMAFDNAHREMLQTSFKSIIFQIASKAWLPFPFGTFTFPGDTYSLALSIRLYFMESYRKYKENVKYLNEITSEYISKVRNDPSISERRDMISNFINSRATANMSNEELKAVVLNLTIAGRDTTACTLSWMFYLLTQNPEVQEKVCQEIDEKLRMKIPTLDDLEPDNMPYLNGMLYETLRLYPAVPMDEKFVTADTEYLDGTKVPKGTKFMFCPYAMGRDKNIYKDPLKVDPTRWIPFKQPSLYSFPVFQAGPRFCLGKDMAQFEAKLVASMLLQRFTFTMAESEAEKITYALALTMSVCNSKSQDSHNLWITPHLRDKTATRCNQT